MKCRTRNDVVAGYGSQLPCIIVPTIFWNDFGAVSIDGALLRKASSVQIWNCQAATTGGIGRRYVSSET